MQAQAQQIIADSVLKNTYLLIEALKDNYRQYSIRGHQRSVENFNYTYDNTDSVQSLYHQRKIDELKSGKCDIDYVAEYDIASECECDVNLIRLWNLVQSIKTDMFCFIEREDDILCFIDGEQTDHEGYVLSNQFGTYKIVDRQQFSRANFNMAKNW